MSWKGESESNIKYCFGREVGLVQRFTTVQNLDTIDGEPMEFEWHIFPGFTTLQLVDKVQEFMTKVGDPSLFQGRIIFMSMCNDIIWRNTDNEQECIANATLVSFICKKISSRTLVIPRNWVRKEVVFY